MAKFSGVVGFAETQVTAPGVHTEVFTERPYFGDVERNIKQAEDSEYLNDNIDISNAFSIVADPYANAHYFAIRYVTWMGAKWKVTSVEVRFPRLLLNVGGVYNGPTN